MRSDGAEPQDGVVRQAIFATTILMDGGIYTSIMSSWFSISW